jgi:hypothetical protein
MVCGDHREGNGGVGIVAGEEGLEVRVHCCERNWVGLTRRLRDLGFRRALEGVDGEDGHG